MRYALALLLFTTGRSLAQTLAPVDAASSGMWPLVIVAIIAAACVGFYFWHKRNPSAATAAADTAAATVKADALALGQKALDLARGLRDTVDKHAATIAVQAAVIASPPVQAVINAPPQAVTGPPPGATGFGPMTAPMPPTVTAAPYTGPFFNIKGEPDPMGQYDARTWKIAAGQAVDEATTRANGPIDVKILTDGDKAFLLYAQENYTSVVNAGAQLFFAVLNGSKADIDAAIAWADTHRNQVTLDTRLGGEVDAYSKGLLKPVYTNS